MLVLIAGYESPVGSTSAKPPSFLTYDERIPYLMNHSHDRLIHWARAYDLVNGLLGRRGSRLREMFADDLGLHGGDRVLDVGCGTGRLAMTFAK